MSAAATKTNRSNRKLWSQLPILLNLTVIIALVFLDVRDLIYKAVWIGPTQSWSFESGSSSWFVPDHLVPNVRPPSSNATSFLSSAPKNLTALQPNLANVPTGVTTSGWPSFLSRCEKVHPFSDGPFFLSAMAINCHVDELGTLWPKVVFTSNHRADSMAWSSCQLLPVTMRPPVCYEEIVSSFLNRYHLPFPTNIISSKSVLSIEKQNQLLRLLELISDSLQYAHQIICVEIVEFELDTFLTPFAFGCASPDVFRSEFVSLPDFWKLEFERGWLTMDVLQAAGFEFAIRQDTTNQYIIRNTTPADSTSSSTYQLRSTTPINFSSFGHFYAFLLVIDATLLVLNLWSSVEILERFIAPAQKSIVDRLGSAHHPLGAIRPTAANRDGGPSAMDLVPSQVVSENSSMYYSYFSSSLYRNTSVAILTIITQCLSWFIVLPNSVVWTWSEVTSLKVRAYQTSIRVWVLLLLLMHAVWDLVVKISERLAYRFVRNTYLTSVDIVLSTIVVSLWLRDKIFKICEIKWVYERQRVNDLNSFTGYIAHGNTFSVANDYVTHTPMFTLWTIYKPLVQVLFAGVGFAFAIALLKFAKNWLFTLKAGKSRDVARRCGSMISGPPLDEYHRLPMEIMLQSPIRARSLIRTDAEMEIYRNGQWEIRPSCFVDYGVSVADGFYRSRAYFSSYIKPVLHHDHLKNLVNATEAAQTSQPAAATQKANSQNRE